MDQRSPTFEATLLYGEPFIPSARKLIESITPIMQSHGETVVEIERIDDSYTLVKGTKIQILFNFSDQPPPLDALCLASDPKGQQNHIVELLTQSRGSTTILVLDLDPCGADLDPAPLATKRSICWNFIAALNDLRPAELTFWAETEALYSAEEFETVHLTDEVPSVVETAQEDAKLTDADKPKEHAFLRGDPQVSDECQSLLDRMLPAKGESPELLQAHFRRSPLEVMMSYARPIWSNKLEVTAAHSRVVAASMASVALVLVSAEPLGLTFFTF